LVKVEVGELGQRVQWAACFEETAIAIMRSARNPCRAEASVKLVPFSVITPEADP
jgi:hypothetical protein